MKDLSNISFLDDLPNCHILLLLVCRSSETTIGGTSIWKDLKEYFWECFMERDGRTGNDGEQKLPFLLINIADNSYSEI